MTTYSATMVIMTVPLFSSAVINIVRNSAGNLVCDLIKSSIVVLIGQETLVGFWTKTGLCWVVCTDQD